MEFVELNIKDFEKFVGKHEQVNFHQTKEWANLKKTTGWEYYYVGIKKGKKVIAASLLLAKITPFRRKIFYAPRGFILDYHDKEVLNYFTEQVVKFAREKKGFFIKIDPYVPYRQRDINGSICEDGFKNDDIIKNLKDLGYRHYGFNLTFEKELQPRWIFFLSLKGKSKEDVWNNFSKDTKRYINRSTKMGLVIEEVTDDTIDDFYKVMEHTSKRRGFIDRPKNYYQDMLKSFGSHIKILSAVLYVDNTLKELKKEQKILKTRKDDASKKVLETGSKKSKDALRNIEGELNSIIDRIKELEVLKKKYGNRIVMASSMFILYGVEVVYLFSGSISEFMKYNAQYFIQSEIINYSIDNKYERYNFYGIEGNFEKENNPTYGIYEFKKGFDGEVVEFIGEFDLVISRFYYYLYKVSFKMYKSMKHLKFRIKGGS